MRLLGGSNIWIFVWETLLLVFLTQPVIYGMSSTVVELLPGNYHLTTWTTDNGLPQNSINQIIQTQDGYLWLATFDGLVRFDGVKFTVFNSKNYPIFKTSRIVDIYESRDGSLWIGTEGGGLLIKRKNGRITLYTKLQGVSLAHVGDFFEDSNGRVWISTNEGMHYFKNGRLYPSSTITAKFGLTQPTYKAFEDSRHNLWFVTGDHVLHCLHDDSISHIPPPQGISRQTIYGFYEDKEHNVWVSYFDALAYIKGGTFTRILVEDVTYITSMAEDRAGNLWAVNYVGMYFLIKDGKAKPFKIPIVSDKGASYQLMVDREGLLWTGSSRSGLHRLRRIPIKAYPISPLLSATSIHQDNKGVVWVGGSTNEIHGIKNGRIKSYSFSQQPQTAVLTDSSGYRWIGGWNELVRVKDHQMQKITRADGLKNARIMALYEDKEKNLWIGTPSGLTVYRNGEFKNFFNSPGFKTSTIISLLKDSRGILWAGTRANGLYRMENGRFTNYSQKNGLSHNAVRSLYEDNTGTLWVGTYGGGLNRFKNGTFVTISTDHGLYDNVVHCILEDHLGFFWMSCNRGVYRVSKQELNEFADGNRNLINCIYFNKADGMEPSECNGGIQPSGCKTADGKLWFPAIQGVLVFDPYEAAMNTKPPPVVVEKIIVDSNEMDLNSKIELSPGVKRLEFHYTGLSFPVPERVHFRFKLDGLEDAWQDVGTRRVAYYNQLPPGKYTFQVIASNNDGIWNETGAALSFYQKPFFFQTDWFTGLCILTALLLVFTFYRLRVRQLKARAEELNRIVESRTLELGEKSKKLEKMDKIKSRFFANISHEFRTPLTLIIGPLEQRLSKIRDKEQVEETGMMLRNSRRLLSLINQLLDLSKLESGRMLFLASNQDVIPFLKGLLGSFESLMEQKEMKLLFHSEHESITLFYDAEKLEKIVVNLVANAIKFTPPGGMVTVTASTVPTPAVNKSGYLEILVSDTGVGIPAEQLSYIFDRFYQAVTPAHRGRRGTGVGLALVKELVELHHGEVFVQSTPGIGSGFTVRLPLGKDHLKTEEICTAPLSASEKLFALIENEIPADEIDKTDTKEIKKEHLEKDVILLAEDNPDMRRFICGALQPYYKVVEAVDGKEGIKKAKQIIPDLIISDIMMPEVDGYELCETLKMDVKTSHIPIILLTAKASDQSKLQGLQTGSDDYITKPFNSKILLTRIKNLIDLRRGFQKKIQREMILQPSEIIVSSVDREFMKELKEAIEKNVSDFEFGVDRLAKALYMSRPTLNRKIKALSGESTNQFIQSYRLKRAAQLLEANFGNVTEVSYEVGFSNSFYFTKCFKEKFHQLPHTYQNNL